MHERSPATEMPLRLLIENVVNGCADAEQQRELERRLLHEEQARDAYLNYVNLHAALNRRFLAGDAEEGQLDIAAFVESVSKELRAKPVRGQRSGWIYALAAACLLVAIITWQFSAGRTTSPPPHLGGPLLVDLEGEVRLQGPDGSESTPAAGRLLQPGETLVTQDEQDRIALRYEDGTQIFLLGSSELTIEASSCGKFLHLKSGLLQADVKPQPAVSPLRIKTPQASVRVLGTRFELAADAQEGTRLDLESGRVELSRNKEKPVQVEPNTIAFVPAGEAPIRILPRRRVDASPEREMSYGGLRSFAYSADGATLIAATRWQALYWRHDDRQEIVPLSAHGREGIRLLAQENSLLGYFDQHERCLVVWDAEARAPLSTFREIGPLRRKFARSAERPEDWNAAMHLVELAPEANQMVFQVGREFRMWRSEQPVWPEFAAAYDGQFVGALAISPDGNSLAVAVRRSKLDLCDIASGEVKTSWPLAHEVPYSLAFSADGARLVLGLGGKVRVYDVATGDVLANLEEPGLPFLKVAISADGRHVAAAALGEHVWIWDVNGAAEFPLLAVGGGIRHVAFSPTGRELAVLSRGNRLTVWHLPSRSEPREAAAAINLSPSTQNDSR